MPRTPHLSAWATAMLACWTLVFGPAPHAVAGPPSSIPYQGVLTDDAGVPLDGDYDLRFSLWSESAGGAEYWFEQRAGFTIQQGTLDALLGETSPIPSSVFNDPTVFLEIAIGPAGGGATTALGPRQRLGSAPYALSADRVGDLTLAEIQSDVDGRVASHSLDEAYDAGGPGAGRVITADAGALQILGSGGLSVSGDVTSVTGYYVGATSIGDDVTVGDDLLVNDDVLVGGSTIINRGTGVISAVTDVNVARDLFIGDDLLVGGTQIIDQSGIITTPSTIIAGSPISNGGVQLHLGGGIDIRNATEPYLDLLNGSEDFEYRLSFFGTTEEELRIVRRSSLPFELRLVNGTLDIALAAGTGGTTLCRGAQGNVRACSSTARLKHAIRPLSFSGIETVSKLAPREFVWNEIDEPDFGFIAEEVAEIDPLLATYGDDGELIGVKYRQLTAVLAKALQEQQELMERMQDELEALRSDLRDLGTRMGSEP